MGDLRPLPPCNFQRIVQSEREGRETRTHDPGLVEEKEGRTGGG